MTPNGSRAKGKRFERKVVEILRKHFDLDKKSCYRTPMSGGHWAASQTEPGDVQFDPEFRKRFPFHIECKNHKTVSLDQFFLPVGQRKKLETWIAQVRRGPKEFQPLLVMNIGREIYAALDVFGFEVMSGRTLWQHPAQIFDDGYLVFDAGEDPKPWIMLRFKDFLRLWSQVEWAKVDKPKTGRRKNGRD